VAPLSVTLASVTEASTVLDSLALAVGRVMTPGVSPVGSALAVMRASSPQAPASASGTRRVRTRG
jgi:hypothetical protein